MHFQPYKSDMENLMEQSSLYVIFFSFFLALLSVFTDQEVWTGALLLAINSVWLSGAIFFAFVKPLFPSAIAAKVHVVRMSEFKPRIMAQWSSEKDAKNIKKKPLT